MDESTSLLNEKSKPIAEELLFFHRDRLLSFENYEKILAECENDATKVIGSFMARFTFGYWDPSSNIIELAMSKKHVRSPKVEQIAIFPGYGIVIETDTCFLLAYEKLETIKKDASLCSPDVFWGKLHFTPILKDLQQWKQKTEKYGATTFSLRYFKHSGGETYNGKNVYFLVRGVGFIERLR